MLKFQNSVRNRFKTSSLCFSPRVRRAFAIVALALWAASAVLAADSADPKRYLDDVKALTIPAMEGRGDGTEGLSRAARLIERRFRALGLKPAGTSSYVQPFTVSTGARLKAGNRLEMLTGTAKSSLRLRQDYVPFSFSSSGAVTAPVVFAGYGISAPEFDYDDYAHLDVKDKIVLVLRYEPARFTAQGEHGELTQHSHLITKAINAKNHGARAVILINGNRPGQPGDELTRFGSASGPENAGILFVHAKNAVAETWFSSSGTSLAKVQEQIRDSSRPVESAFSGNPRVSLNVNIETIRATVNNVLAYLPGKTDEYVIIGAHYDHLGRGEANSLAPSQAGQIHPGADDNASGTAGVLELARLAAEQKGQLERGILFASFAGEELGLLGSAEWASTPTLPLEKAVAMINMDMIGRIKDGKVFIGGAGTGSTFKDVLEQAQGKYPFQIEYSVDGYGASDHTSFVTQKIPVLFFFSGLHADYHKPSDTWEKINADGAARLLDMVLEVALNLDSAGQRPAFVAVAPDHAGNPTTSGGGGGGYGPYFGSIPDFAEQENGVKFSDVRPGSPAAKAGLKAGDVLVQFGDKAIKNLYDFTDALRRSKAGDVVEVKVMRDGSAVSVPVTLEQRR